VRLGDDGELVVRAPHLCTGYLGEPPLAELRTGDLARLDADGRLVLLGRARR
jgi:long-subunit acyl-CoA synthetase (AMP-forming)